MTQVFRHRGAGALRTDTRPDLIRHGPLIFLYVSLCGMCSRKATSIVGAEEGETEEKLRTVPFVAPWPLEAAKVRVELLFQVVGQVD